MSELDILKARVNAIDNALYYLVQIVYQTLPPALACQVDSLCQTMGDAEELIEKMEADKLREAEDE